MRFQLTLWILLFFVVSVAKGNRELDTELSKKIYKHQSLFLSFKNTWVEYTSLVGETIKNLKDITAALLKHQLLPWQLRAVVDNHQSDAEIVRLDVNETSNIERIKKLSAVLHHFEKREVRTPNLSKPSAFNDSSLLTSNQHKMTLDDVMDMEST
jgi:hypothetical protein